MTIMGIGEYNTAVDIHQSDLMAGPTGAKEAGRMAFDMAGIKLDDVDACEIYDCFTYTVEITLQDYGFFGPGEGKDWFDDGRTAPGGEMPVNTSGGSLGMGHLLDASGMSRALEVVLQLRGNAGDRQLAKVDTGLAQSWRGVPTTSGAVVILAN